MDLKLHANATTTPRTRAYIQKSQATNAALARELGIHSRTVARWKARPDVTDRSTRPHRLSTSLTEWEEALVVELRRCLALPLDDIVETMRRCLNPELSRSAIHRCLQRHGISTRLTPEKAPAVAFHTDNPAGFIHIDVKYLPPLDRRRSYAYVAIDRATRFVYLEILPDRRADTAAGFLARFLERFQLNVHTVLTDNGSEFTDRFAVDKKRKPHDKPSGHHAFDRLCARHSITHRLIRPFHPQTNGMVERFNRRLGDHLGRVPQNRAAHHRRFLDHAERDAYLHAFVVDYNRTRLRCLDYQAPAELLAKLAGHNTQAGAHPSSDRQADPWIPACAGKAFWLQFFQSLPWLEQGRVGRAVGDNSRDPAHRGRDKPNAVARGKGVRACLACAGTFPSVAILS
jgi:transposase-like protein